MEEVREINGQIMEEVRDQWTIMEEVKVLHMIQAFLAQAEETCLQMRAPAMRESRGAKD